MSKTPKTLLFSDLAGLTVLRNRIHESSQQNYGKQKLLTMIDTVISRITRQMVQPDVHILQAMQEGLSSIYSAISKESSQPSTMRFDWEEEEEELPEEPTPPPKKVPKKASESQKKRK